MAGQDRPTPHPLIQALEATPYAFDFFAALRRLEALRPDAPRVGTSMHLAEDPAIFSQDPSLAFAPSSVTGYRRGEDGRPARLFVAFLGLLGPNGPMPLHLSEYARDRERNSGDATFARFLDIFNHRMIALFYKAWCLAQMAAQFDRPESDRFSVHIASLFGLGFDSLRDRDAVPDSGKLYHAGHLANQTRHADGLCQILQDYFALPTRIDQFVGQWLELPAESRCLLGRSRQSASLGVNAIVGARVWDCQQKFRVRLGPMRLVDYERMLPGGSGLTRLAAWIRTYDGLEHAWDLQLVLRKEEVPAIRLGSYGRLGWSSWLKTRTATFDHDASDLILSPRMN